MVQQAILQQRVDVETAPPTPPEPPTTRGSNRLLVYLRILRVLHSDDYQRARLDTILNMALNTNDKEPSKASPSTSVTFFPVHHLTTAVQGDSHQRHLHLEGRPEDESTPRSRGTGSRTEPAALPLSWKASTTPSNHPETLWRPTRLTPSLSRQQTPSRNVSNGLPSKMSGSQSHSRAARPFLAMLPGPDGLTACQLRAIPPSVLTRICNLILWCAKLPEHLAILRTIFIPKKSGAKLPGDF